MASNTPTQDRRSIKVYTSLADNTLLFSAMSGVERMSTLFNYRLELVSTDHEINLDDLLGTEITVELELPVSDYVSHGSYRYFHGIVADCAHIGSSDELAHYEFSIRPWYWLLTRTTDCRIFQEMTVPDIIEQVLSDAGFSDIEDALTSSYEQWRYCVQYRETDYNFLNRLMEQEGIYFYFEHKKGRHVLVLADSYSSHGEFPQYDTVPIYPAENGQIRERDHIQTWQLQKVLQPGRFAVRDFNFETPKANMQAQSSLAGSHARADNEIYDYPGEYPGADGVPVIGTGEVVARHRMEEMAAQHELASGGGTAAGLCAGYIFSLSGCERSDQNREYLIVESRVNITMDAYRSGGSSHFEFHGNVTAIHSQTQFRAPRVTPKPIVQGPQTAIVVGPSGEEIWTDKFGRVKLQFHWDRYGESSENSSCWVRVSQVWAGQGWGAIHIPRIGHEVIVEFLEGDPDRPIITGRVYNGDNGVPYDLPANQTQSGIKSRSTKTGSGGNFNEIRMEDKEGHEELYIHAEKNMNVLVENDKTLKVGFDKSDKGDYTVDIKNHRSVTIDSGNDTLLVKTGDRNSTVSTGDHNTVVSTGNKNTEVNKGDCNTEVLTGNYKTKVAKGNHTLNVDSGSSIIEAMQSITLKVGGNSLVIDQAGVTINGVTVKIEGKTTAEMKGGVTAKVEGGAMAELKAAGMTAVKGGITMIG